MIPAAVLIKIAFLLSLALPCILSAEPRIRPFFVPPKGFIQVDPPPSSKVKAAFLQKSKQGFSPSVNLTEERISLSIEEYLQAVEKLYTANSRHRWRRWGTLKTSGGTAHLTSLDMELPAGNVRVLQSFLLKEGTVYILTASVSAEEFDTHRKEFIASFRSLDWAVSEEEDPVPVQKNSPLQKPQ